MFAVLLALLVTTPDASTPWLVPPIPNEADFPVFAQRAGIDGQAVVTCTSLSDGRLSECSVLSVTPTGLGYEQAALQTAMRGDIMLKMTTNMRHNQRIQFTVNFASKTHDSTLAQPVWQAITPTPADERMAAILFYEMTAQGQSAETLVDDWGLAVFEPAKRQSVAAMIDELYFGSILRADLERALAKIVAKTRLDDGDLKSLRAKLDRDLPAALISVMEYADYGSDLRTRYCADYSC